MAKEVKKKFILPIWLLILDVAYVVGYFLVKRAITNTWDTQGFLGRMSFITSTVGKICMFLSKYCYKWWGIAIVVAINLFALMGRVGFNRKLDLARASKTSVVVQSPSTASAPVVTQAPSNEGNMNLF